MTNRQTPSSFYNIRDRLVLFLSCPPLGDQPGPVLKHWKHENKNVHLNLKYTLKNLIFCFAPLRLSQLCKELF